jgi:hypothetical protein
MTKFRSHGPDVMPTPAKKPEPKPGVLNEHHIPIYDHKGRMRGHVGPLATASTVARFTGQHGSKLGKKEGKTAWLSPPPPPPPKPQIDPTAVAVAKATPKPSNESHKVEISVKQAMGSASKKKPDKPETRARPKRG